MSPRPRSQPEIEITEEQAEELVDADSVGEIRHLAVAELKRRFEDPAQAAKLAATGLLNLVNASMRLAEARMAKESQQQAVNVDPVEMIMSAPLPDDRKLAQLEKLAELHHQTLERIESERTVLQRRQGEPERGVPLRAG